MSGDRRMDRALALIGELTDLEPRSIRPEMPLADLGFDSLAFAELALALEAELDVDLGAAMLDGSGTVADVLGAVARAHSSRGKVDLPAPVGRLQGAANLLVGRALGWWLALEVEGAEHVPRRGPAVLAMNHESALDIPIAVIACPRRVTFMAKQELFKNAAASWTLERLGGFRVDRGRFDLRAVRCALAVVRRGGVLGMYPEGTRSPGRLLPFLDGAAWVALRAGAPLIPVSLLGTDVAGHARVPRRASVHVVFGEPITVPRVDDPAARRRRARQLTSQLRKAVEAGLPP
jgi:1-acyl-sn-glycerol-3-phosphate acyltransferase